MLEDESRAFHEAPLKLYKGMMKRARDRALKLFSTDDLAECIEEGRPNWIQLDI